MNVLCFQPMQLLLTRDRKPLRNRKPTTKPGRNKRFKHVYVDVEDLGRTVGIEFTFTPGGFTREEGMETNIDSLAGALRPAFRKRLLEAYPKIKLTDKGVTTDPGVIEIPSAKTSSRKEIKRVAQVMHKVAASLHMVGHTDWHGGGGAHVHVDVKAVSKEDSWGDIRVNFATSPTMKALLLDATNRPYIYWAFANPGDNNNTKHTASMLTSTTRDIPKRTDLEYNVANAREDLNYGRSTGRDYMRRYTMTAKAYMLRSEWTRREAIKYVLEMYRNDEGKTIRRYKRQLRAAQAKLAAFVEPEPTKRDGDQDYAHLLSHIGKSYGIAPRSCFGTAEFRIFQAPNNPAEHELHINFALAYVEWAEAQAKVNKYAEAACMTAAQVTEAWQLDRCKKEFSKFCGMIGLKSNRYKRYLANMERRFSLGPMYLG